jgi:3-hydroxy acid dehydrogenase / malonic semialdehyde reductase
VRFKGDAEKAATPFRGVEPMSAEEVAETVFWSCTLPRHVNINRLQLMPVQQAFGPLAFHRK